MPDSDMVLVRRDDLRTLMDEDDGGSTSVSFFEPDVFARLLAAVNGVTGTVEDRVNEALCRFVFPDHLVPRGAMARAVVAAITHGEDFRDYLPAKTIVGPWTTQETP